MKNQTAALVLENGVVFYGYSLGTPGNVLGEVVFNTAMTGYQEILTDPSYANQLITFTTPHIGNVGINATDNESHKIWAKGVIVRNAPQRPSHFQSQQTLNQYLKSHGVVGIYGIDTRHLTRILRNHGSLRGNLITTDSVHDLDVHKAQKAAQSEQGTLHQNLTQIVSTPKPYVWGETQPNENRPRHPHHIVVYDYGVKQQILRQCARLNCRLTVVPATTPAHQVLAMRPDGILLSNGPGDPAACTEAIHIIQLLLKASIPLMGICLGHQLLALACGAKTIKMKFGHHGSNHPVQSLATKKVMITSQNHGFAVDESSLPSTLEPTYRSLFDGSLQGFIHREKQALGFQGHPEGGPGPHDLTSLFKTAFPFLSSVEEKMHA